MRRLLGATIMGVLIVSILLFSLHSYEKRKRLDLFHDSAIVRLHDANGRFFCSGVVITGNAIATAAHCLVIETPWGIMVNPDAKIEVRGADGLPTGIFARIRNINPRLDTGMLTGNFAQFNFRDIEQDPAEIDKIFMDPDAKIMACGYPLGGGLACTPVLKVKHSAFWYKAIGWLYPGMSGGPVIDMKSGKVIALNRAVDDDGIILTPLVEFLQDMLRG